MTRHIPPQFNANWGGYLCKLKRYGDDLPILQGAVKEDPALWFACYNMGFALSQLQRHADAIPNYRTAFDLNGTTAEDFIWIGDIFRKGGLCDEAVQVYGIVPPGMPGYTQAQAAIRACGG